MTIYQKIGFAVMILGLVIFFIGVSTVSLQAEINPMISEIGAYSFFSWFPTMIIGLALYFFGSKRQN